MLWTNKTPVLHIKLNTWDSEDELSTYSTQNQLGE